MLIALLAVLGVDLIVVVVVVGGARIEVAAASDPGGRGHAG
jgi:hypothetical protein